MSRFLFSPPIAEAPVGSTMPVSTGSKNIRRPDEWRSQIIISPYNIWARARRQIYRITPPGGWDRFPPQDMTSPPQQEYPLRWLCRAPKGRGRLRTGSELIHSGIAAIAPRITQPAVPTCDFVRVPDLRATTCRETRLPDALRLFVRKARGDAKKPKRFAINARRPILTVLCPPVESDPKGRNASGQARPDIVGQLFLRLDRPEGRAVPSRAIAPPAAFLAPRPDPVRSGSPQKDGHNPSNRSHLRHADAPRVQTRNKLAQTLHPRLPPACYWLLRAVTKTLFRIGARF